MRQKSAQTLDDGLRRAHHVFSVEPKRRFDTTEAVDRLLDILDDEKFIEAWDELKEEADGRRPDQPRSTRPFPNQH